MDNNWISFLKQQMEGLDKSSLAFLPEWLLIGLIVLSLVLSLGKWRGRWLVFLGLGGLLAVLFLYWPFQASVHFSSMAVRDMVGQVGKLMMAFSCLWVFGMAWGDKRGGEFFPLALGGLLGGFMAVMGQNLLLIILSLELISLVSYILVAMEKESKEASRSALQYLLFGLFSSAISLYGLSWLYGLTGSMDLFSEAFMQGIQEADPGVCFMVLLMLSGAFLFKLSAFPFHFWTPQIYAHASYPLLTYLSTIPKIAGAIVLLRLFHALEAWDQIQNLQLVILTLAALSMFWGNLSALNQQKFKPLMAFSGVAHAGYILLGLAWIGDLGQAAVLFYLFAYVLMNLGVLSAASFIDASDNFEHWAGKSRVHLYASIAMLVHLVSLTGLPPSVGFVGKLYLFSSGVELIDEGNQAYVVAFLSIAIINTLISLFYYLKPAIWLFLRKGKIEKNAVIGNDVKLLPLVVLTLLVLGLGIFGFDKVLDFLLGYLWK